MIHLALASDTLSQTSQASSAGYEPLRDTAASLMRICGRVQAGVGDASKWLRLFSEAYEKKTGRPIFPGSLNLDLGASFDWHAPYVAERHIWFDRSEMGSERDVLLVPCVLENLSDQPAFLWSTTNATRNRADPWVVELICEVGLRETYGLADGDEVSVSIL